MKIKCQIGLHNWSNWTKPQKRKKDSIWDYKSTFQTKFCHDCGKSVVHEL